MTGRVAVDHQVVGPEAVLEAAGATLRISFVTPAIVRIRASAPGAPVRERPWSLTAGHSLSAGDVRMGPQGVTCSSDVLDVRFDGGGRLAIHPHDSAVPRLEDTAPGFTWDAAGGRSSWSLRNPTSRRHYGFGERTGLLDKRGRRYTCWTTDEWRHQGPTTDRLYVAIPFELALDPDGAAFGLLLDVTERSESDLRAMDREVMTISAEADHLDWLYIHGPEPSVVVERLTWLVGRPPMPPRWALGYHQARWSYASDGEVRAIAEALRRHRVPADAIHLDIDHMDGFRSFSWDPGRFRDPGRLVHDLRTMGLRTTVVVDAAVTQDGADRVYAEGHRRGFFVRRATGVADEYRAYQWAGPSVLPDHVRPEVRRWWGALYGHYLAAGVAGFLNDMNEPALHDRPFEEEGSANTEPPPETPFGPPELGATHAEVRNVYATLEDEATYEGLRSLRPNERPFVVTRSGGTGVSRYAAVWTGDNASLWEHLEMSIPQLLGLGLSGVPLAGADIGGFFGDCSPELLVRWTQLGAFYPFARNNSARDTLRQEPWTWEEPTLSRCRRALRLRYRLLPYLYTRVEEAHRRGWPVLRPLFLEFPQDAAVRDIDDELLVGADLLVAPVVRPGASARRVHLPRGVRWLDLRSSRWHDGGQDILVRASLDELPPILARDGTVLPLGPAMDWSDERPLDPLTLHVMLGAVERASGSVYEDDGHSMDFESGASRRVMVHAIVVDGGIQVSGEPEGTFRVPDRVLRLVVHCAGGRHRAVLPDDRDGWSVRIACPHPRLQGTTR